MVLKRRHLSETIGIVLLIALTLWIIPMLFVAFFG